MRPASAIVWESLQDVICLDIYGRNRTVTRSKEDITVSNWDIPRTRIPRANLGSIREAADDWSGVQYVADTGNVIYLSMASRAETDTRMRFILDRIVLLKHYTACTSSHEPNRRSYCKPFTFVPFERNCWTRYFEVATTELSELESEVRFHWMTPSVLVTKKVLLCVKEQIRNCVWKPA
jgi:hypothetical protein